MKLYIIRHAQAEERHIFAQTGKDDSKRPLTDKGIEKMEKSCEFLKKHEPNINLFLQSDLTRSKQTIDILKEFYPDSPVETTSLLNPSFLAKELYEKIMSYDLDSMALVGHEPDLGQFISWLLFKQASDNFPIKKGGMAKVDIYHDGRSYLKWLIRPKLV